jgi:hypothetical protein
MNWEIISNYLIMNYKLTICGLQVNYECITNGLWTNYEVMDGNPCEWTPFIMWSCLILVAIELSLFCFATLVFLLFSDYLDFV